MAQEINFAAGLTSVYMDKNYLYPPEVKKTDIETGFEFLFKSHFKALHAYACTMIREEGMAEEIVQNVFCRLWEKKDQIEISQSAKAYLYRSVYNESLNHLKHQKVRANYHTHAARNTDTAQHASQNVVYSELEQHLEQALRDLPEQCRTIFQMSRFEELKYREIAEQMGLSIKTIENQMGKALRILRSKLIDFLPAFIFSLLNL